MDAHAPRDREGCSAAEVDGQRRYARHRPEDTMLYQMVEQHTGPFFEHLSEQGASLPGYVRDEFDAYIDCGRIECGFVRAKCESCRYEYLVPSSCRKRGFCPSCGVRRMVETAAQLVDHVLPCIPMGQWVVRVLWPPRRVFAARPDWLTRDPNPARIVTRALSGDKKSCCVYSSLYPIAAASEAFPWNRIRAMWKKMSSMRINAAGKEEIQMRKQLAQRSTIHSLRVIVDT